MICTQRDQYMKKLIRQDLSISWIITLTDGTVVYGDYERPDHDNPWNRLRKHCKENKANIRKIELHMLGTPKLVFFEDENGLDGIMVMRGVGKEQSMAGDHTQSYQTLTVGLLNEDCSAIDVKKYTWPINEFEEFHQKRSVTKQNVEYMIFKNESEKIKHPKIQEFINGATV
jgi:hypothetical protein